MSPKQKQKIEYLPLLKAAEACGYTQEYLSLRARSGKLKAKKLGRNWYTTLEWLNQYLAENGKLAVVLESGEGNISEISNFKFQISNKPARLYHSGGFQNQNIKTEADKISKAKFKNDSQDFHEKLSNIQPAQQLSFSFSIMDGLKKLLARKGDAVEKISVVEKAKKNFEKDSMRISSVEFSRRYVYTFFKKAAIGMAAVLVIANIAFGIRNQESRLRSSLSRVTDAVADGQAGIRKITDNILASLNKVSSIPTSLKSFAEAGKNQISESIFVLSDGIEEFKNTPDNFKFQISRLCLAASAGQANFKKISNNQISNIKKISANLASNIQHSISNRISKVAFTLKDGLEEFKNTPENFTTILSPITNGTQREFNGIINDIKKISFMISDGVDEFKNTKENFAIAMSPIIQQAASYKLQATRTITRTVDEIKLSMTNAVSSISGEVENSSNKISRILMGSLREGIKNYELGIRKTKDNIIMSRRGIAEIANDAKYEVSKFANDIKSGAKTYKSVAKGTLNSAASLWDAVKSGAKKTVKFVLSPWIKNSSEQESLNDKLAKMEEEREALLSLMSEEKENIEEKYIEEISNFNSPAGGTKETEKAVEVENKEEGSGVPASSTGSFVSQSETQDDDKNKKETVINQTITHITTDDTKLALTGGTITGALNVEGMLTGGQLSVLGDSTLAGGLVVGGSSTLSTLTVTGGSIFERNIYASGGLSAGNLSIDSAGNLRVSRIYQDNSPLHISSTGSAGDITFSAGRSVNIAARQTIVDGNFDVLKGLNVRGADLTITEDLIVGDDASSDKLTNTGDTQNAYISGSVELDGTLYADGDAYIGSSAYISDNIKAGDGTPENVSLAAGSKSGYITGDFEIDGTLYAAAMTTPYTNTITVAKAGGDYTTIQAAINACYGSNGTNGTCGTLSATNGALIRVMPGVYEEAVTMHSYIDVKSAGGYQSTTITQADNASAVVITASNSTLEGFTISATGTPAAATISAAATSPNIFNNKIITAAADTYYCIEITTGSPRIEGNFIGDGTGSRGLRVSGSGSPHVSYNTFYNTVYDLANTGTGTIYSSFNTFRQSASTNIYVSAGASVESDNDNYKKVSNAGTLIDLTGSKEYAVSGADEAVGEAVYISGADTVDEAKADNSATMPAIGLIIKKISATRALVKSSGIYYNSAAPFSAGSAYYISAATAGSIAAAVPPQNAQIVGYAKSSSELILLDPSYDSSSSSGSMDYHNVLTVAKSGATYTSIQSAIDACYGADGTNGDCGTLSATNGALIRVMPGAYAENITMHDYIDIISAAGSDVTKITQTNQTVVTTASNSRLEGFAITKTVDDASAIISVLATSPTLNDLAVVGGGVSSQVGINVTTGSPKIHNLELITCNIGVQTAAGSPTIERSQISATTDIKVTGAGTIASRYNSLLGTTNFNVAATGTVESAYDLFKTITNAGNFRDMSSTRAFTVSGTAEAVGEVVYASAADTADEAKADSASTMPAIGIIIKKPSDTEAIIKSSGIYYNSSAPFTAGATYYVSASTAGAITSTKPAGELAQIIGQAKSTTELVLNFDQLQNASYDNVITVAKKGGDYTSIQSAIDACYGTDGTDGTCGALSATNGAVIRVMPGSYSESLTMRAFIDVVSTGGPDVTIITQSTSSIITGASNCRLKGFTLNKTTDNTTAIISAGSTSGKYDDLNIAGAGIANQTAFSITSGSPRITNVKIDNVSTAVSTATGSPYIENADIFPTVTGAVGVNHTGASGTTTIRNSRIAGTTDIYASGSGAAINSHSNLLTGTTNFNSASGATINSYKDSYTTVTQVGAFNQKDYVINSTIAALTVQQDSTGNIVDFKDGSISVFVINNGGNVGIGDSAPDYPLEILSTSGPQFSISYDDGVDYATMAVDGNGDLTFVVSGGDISFSDENLATTGNLSLNADNALLSLGAAGSTDYNIKWDGSDAVHTITAGDFVFSGGNVGIGTTEPNAKFEVYQSGSEDIANFYKNSNEVVSLDTNGILSMNPFQLRVVSTLEDLTNLEGINTIDVVGKYAYVGYGFGSSNQKGISIIDISDPTNPVLEGTYSNATHFNMAAYIKVQGDYAYVSSWSTDKIVVLNISNPSDIQYVSSYYDSDLGVAHSFKIVGNYLYLTDGSNELSIIDISDPTNLVLAGKYTDATYLHISVTPYIVGDYAYVANWTTTNSALTILNISDPSNITRVGSYEDHDILGNSYGLVVRGKFAYITGSATDSFAILDVSDPTNITYAGSYSSSTYLDGAETLNLVGDYAVVGNKTSANNYHIAILNIASSTNPTFVTALDSNEFQPHHNLVVRGRYIYGYQNTTDKFVILEMPALDIPSATFGNVVATELAVDNDVDIGRNLFVHNGLNIGSGLFVNDGETNLIASSTRTAFTVKQLSTGDIVNIFDGSTEVFTILDGGNVGIRTTAPDKALEINSATGANMRLTYNDSDGTATNYSDFAMSSSGDLTISASGGDISFSDENLATTGQLSAEHLISTDDADINDNLTVGDIIIDEAVGVLAFSGNTSASILTTSASNNILTIGGSNQTNNENLTLDFETTANKVLVSTGTGVTSVDFGTVNLETDYLDLSSGTIASVGNITGTGSISGFLSVSGTTLTDGTLSISGGNLTSAGNITGAGAVTISSTAADLTLANITSGNIILKPSADSDDYFTFSTASNIPSIFGTGAYLRIGDAATTSHSLSSEDDLMVSRNLEIDGSAYFDSNIYAGVLEFGQDAGLTAAFDMPVSSSAVDNTVEGYNFAVDGTNILTVYSQSDGAGSIDTTRVGIGTIAPSAKLHTIETTEQLRLGYDASNYWSGTVGATGGLTLAGTGAGGALTLTPTAGQNLNVSLSTTGDFAVNTSQLYVDTSAGNVGIGTTGPSSKLDITTAGLGVTQTTSSGLALVNTTAAVLDTQQISPAIRWSGYGWKTDATAASQAVDFRSYVVPVQGAANPTGYLSFGSSVNGGAYNDGQMVLTTAGNVGIGTTAPSSKLSVSGDIRYTGSNILSGRGATSAGTGASDYRVLAVGNLELGTTNTFPGSGAYMVLTNAGNVGIGTTGPTANLQVAQGTAGVGTVSNSAGGTTVTGVGTQFLNTFKVGDTITINTETVAISAIASNTSMTTAAITGANSGVAYTLTGGTRLSVLGNGNVGIGTTAPDQLLTLRVSSNVAATNPTINLHREDPDHGTGYTRISELLGTIQFTGNDASSNMILGSRIFATAQSNWNTAISSDLAFAVKNSGVANTALYIQQTGNVGIGTTSPLMKLNTVGGIMNTGSATVTSFAGTVSSSGTTITFSSAADAILAGYDATATNQVIGTTIIAGGQTRYIASWSGSTTCVVSSAPDPAWSATAITSVQKPVYLAKLNSNAIGMVVNSTGNVGIGTATPDNLLDLEDTGTAKANEDVMHITNKANAADMDGTETSILFNQWYYDAATPAVADSGRISIGTETDWINTASTHDSYMAFETAVDGTVTERMRIDSNGDVGIGVTGAATDKLQVLTNDATNAGLTVQQDGAGNIVNFKDGSTTVFTINGDGNTTIGNTGKSTTVNGSLNLSSATTTFKPASVSLVPEYPNSVYYADGTSNTGTLTSDYDSTNYHNYYRWTTSSDNQDYDIVVRWLVPEDFNGFDTSYDFKIYNKVSDTGGNTSAALSMKDTANAAVSFVASTTFKNASWTQSTAEYSGTPTFTASNSTTPQWITFQIKLTADNGDNADVGEISFRYNRQQ